MQPMIGVKNITEGEKATEFKSRYDGKDYVFRPGEVTALSLDAATHIFGYGLEDKTAALLRFGWLTHNSTYDEAVRRLDDFKFLQQTRVEFEEPTQIKSKKEQEETPPFLKNAQ